MDRHRIMIARLVSAAALVLGCAITAAPTTAVAEDLEGFSLKDWNRMACDPTVLRADAVLNITLPRAPAGYLSILAPGDRFFSIVEPGSPIGSMPTADALATMNIFRLDPATAQGRVSKEAEPIFVQPGAYTILVGTQFETERPIVLGWCRITYAQTT
jgi:hypothetical protein